MSEATESPDGPTTNVVKLRTRTPASAVPTIELASGQDTLLVIGPPGVPAPGELLCVLGLFSAVHWPEEAAPGVEQSIIVEAPLVLGMASLADRLRAAADALGQGRSNFGIGVIYRDASASKVARARWASNVKIHEATSGCSHGVHAPWDTVVLKAAEFHRWEIANLGDYATTRAPA